MITVGELIEQLKEFDPACVVIMQRDSEGNGYAPLAGAEDNGAWDNDNREYGFAELTTELREGGYAEEDCIDGVSAVVLYPNW